MQPHHSSNRSGFPMPILGFALVLLISLASPASSCTEQEKSSLLQLLAGLSRDDGLKASWRSETDCCTWDGVTCSGPARTVTNVSLASRGLEGSISPFLGNLSSLLHLNLSCNLLSGGLPLELVSSNSIIVLDVSFNRLTGGLSELPSSTPARPLQVLNISSNLLTGSFPSTIWEAMKSLVALNASTNSFTGQIPITPCVSAPSFAVLELSFNLFSRNIPPGLSNCSVLKLLSAGYNNLSGTLPDELFKVTSLEHLSLPSNWLEGALNGISKLTNLVTLDLGKNELIGNIPDSIGELKRLEELHLDSNNMSGQLPSTLSDCINLITIDLKSNNFSGQLTKVNFSGLPNLRNLDLNYNNFTGSIPESIYSCSKLTALRLSNNHFHVQLSEKIGNLESLSFLSLVKSSLTNATRTLQILRGCRNLTTLLIGFNFMHETMPEDDSSGGFENLQVFAMNDCSLSGQMPHWLSKLTNLGMIFLHNNQLAGTIPDWISSLNFLFYLDVSNNSLTGEIPTALMEMQMLESDKTAPKVFELPVYYNSQFIQYLMPSAFPKVLNLGNNNFIGLIPEKIGQLKALISLNLSSNRLSGEIPWPICNLTNLQVLDLSVNHLTGVIPAALNNLHFLSKFNISNNDLEGAIPTLGQLSTFPNSSYGGNPKLCGPMLVSHCGSAETPLITKKQRKKKGVFALAFGVSGGVAILLLLASLLILFRCTSFMTRKRSSINDDLEDTSLNFNSEYSLVMVPLGMGEQNKLKLTDLLKATKNFDKDHIIGCGGYGLVYKAELPDGSKVAINKLSSEMCLMEREFSAEVNALSMAQHDNLVPFWGYCIQGSSRLLIYSYMENGSLDDWLHNRDDDAGPFLDWPMRLKIAQGASQGLSYIHNVCKPHIIHRDIKSSNILLDKEFKAYVADFGLSRLIFPNNTHVTTELVGTLGYIPPEYGQEWVATLRGDMYSFGVVLLELVTGRRPVEICPRSKALVQWVQEMRSKGKQIEVLDPTLRGTGYEEQMLEVLEAACQCVNRNPGMRPTIKEVVYFLNSIGANLQAKNSVSTQCKNENYTAVRRLDV